MMTDLLVYAVAKACLILFGLPLAFLRPAGAWSLLPRAAVAYGGGALFLTLHATLLSIAGIPWSIGTLGVPLIVLSTAGVALILRTRERPAGSPRFTVSWWAWSLTGAGLVHFALSVISLRSTSMDYLYFWGPKAVRFTAARGIDAGLLAEPFFMHLRPTYPPLVSIGYSWDSLFTGRMIWRMEMLDSIIWLIATVLVLHAILTASYGPRARIALAFWSVAISASAAASYSAGNAETPLLFYVTVAAAALAERRREMDVLGALMLAGCVLTKSEGRVLWLAIVGGLLLTSFAHRERPSIRGVVTALLIPGIALGSWYAYQVVHRLPLHDQMRDGVLAQLDLSRAGIVATTMVRFLGEGTWGIGWVVPIAILLICRRSWCEAVLPATASIGVMALYLVYYLHEQRPLDIVMWWEVPRISQPSLSLIILAAARVYGHEITFAGSDQERVTIVRDVPDTASV